MKGERFKVGDRVHRWGIGFPYTHTTPGPVTHVEEVDGVQYVSWHNEHFNFSDDADNLMREGTPLRANGFERLLPLED